MRGFFSSGRQVGPFKNSQSNQSAQAKGAGADFAGNPLLDLHDISFSYQNHSVLRNVAFRVWQGDFVTVVGPNGSGKTTLARLILGLLTPNRGRILFKNASLDQRRRQISYVPQQIHFDEAYPISAEQVVAMGLLSATFKPFLSKKEKADVSAAIKRVGAEEFAGHSFSALSGGLRQRVLIARALVSEPGLLIMDEATASVDAHTETEILDLCLSINDQSAVIFITHNLSLIPSIGKRLLCVNNGNVHEHATSDLNRKELLHMLSGKGHMR